jgi:hypothetical protein
VLLRLSRHEKDFLRSKRDANDNEKVFGDSNRAANDIEKVFLGSDHGAIGPSKVSRAFPNERPQTGRLAGRFDPLSLPALGLCEAFAAAPS